jgi:hypothetical protein
MLHGQMSINAAIALLRKEIGDRQSALAMLEALIASGSNGATSVAAAIDKGGERQVGMGKAAVEILAAAGRPMHGTSEIVPALAARGFVVKTRGLATMLLRTNKIERTAPGTFKYRNK